MEPHEHDRPSFSRPPHFPPHHWRGSRRFFWPFAVFFGGITILSLIAISIVIYFSITGGMGQFHGGMMTMPALFCIVPIAFFIITSIVGNFTFRRFGRPMTQIFSAIDSISEGDLTVRVSEHYPRQFGQLARRFNHMVSELERADQQRRNLTADIAHELRTPLHIIQGNIEGLIDGVYQPTTEHINNMLDETRLLARLVNDLQTLSLAEAGQLPLHPTRFFLADLIEDIKSSFSSQAASLGISLHINHIDPTTEITADYDRLNQVLSNLISNAVRHTPQSGSITIETQIIPGGVGITVKDTGAGIPAEDLPFIFDRFWRGSKSRTERVNSGLGLAIAKQLILAHRGTIEVQSDIDKGTTFTIELPDTSPNE
jgi:two-component system OmpR family sensor kinase/two-component system sensor histidine kinase BaeS